MIRAALVDPSTVVGDVAAGVSADAPYTSPTSAEIAAATLGLVRLLIGNPGGATELLAGLGFSVGSDTDPVTGRPYALALSETTTPRAWGLYLMDTSRPPKLCIAVPHPKFDVRTEQLAMRLWRAVPGSILAMAAVHRNAVLGAADPAHTAQSVFHHLWTDVLGPWGVPQVQVHGFADDTAPEQVAVSTGAGPVNAAAVRIADGIAAAGLATTRGWDGTADVDVRATTNQQGIAAGAGGWVWVHLEHNRTVRNTSRLWHRAVDAVAAANPGLPG